MDEKRLPYYHRSSCGVAETVNSKLVWLAAVSSPLLSPGRERAKNVRKKSKHRSIFALPRRAKGSIEAEEPISPKVSCIGQVRTSKISCGSAADVKTDKRQHFRPASSSPGRILTSLGKQFKWASLISLCRHTHHAPPSCPAYGGSEVSRFGLPSYDSSSFCNPERSCGTFLAKSLLLLLECGERTQCMSKGDVQMHAHTRFKDGNENQEKVLVHTADNKVGSSTSCSIAAAKACDVESHSTLFALCREECKAARSSHVCDSKRIIFPTLTLEAQQQERLSVGVALEDPPCKDDENVGPDSALSLNGVSASEVRSSGEGCEGIVEPPIDDITCKSVVSYISTVEEEKFACGNAEIPCKATVQKRQGCDKSRYEELKEHTVTVFDKSQGDCISDVTDRHDWQGHSFCHDVEHQETLLDLNAIDHVLSSISTLPQLSEKDLHCFLIGKDTDCVWDIHKAKRSEACTAQATLIVLDYNLIGNHCKKGASNRATCSELLAVSFHEARGEAKFFRSHSATSYRAVINLQRCKSEPRKRY